MTRAALVAGVVGLGGPASALDTVEPFASGAIDLEGYAGLEVEGGRRPCGEMVLGYGVTPRLSVLAGVGLTAAEGGAGAELDLSLGLVGGLLDTDHLDLDLLLDAGSLQAGPGAVEASTSVEVNLDLEPEAASAGLYLRVAIAGLSPAGEAQAELLLEPGAYWTPAPGHQLLVEAVPFGRARGAVALGYNVVLDETLELGTHLAASPPRGGGRPGVHLVAGLIASL